MIILACAKLAKSKKKRLNGPNSKCLIKREKGFKVD